jgi:hypothetical protein
MIQNQLNKNIPNVTTGNSNQVQAGAQSGAYGSTGNTAQQQTGTTTGTTSSTTGVGNNLGLTSLVQGQAPAVAASDAATNSYLTDFMNTGGTGFNGQVNQAVHGALSGPGVNNAGEMAGARAAGVAASNTAMNNSAQRLQAAQTLRGGTGVGALTQQATPLMGSQTTGTTGQTTGANLTGTETQSGTATGGSASAGYGNAPVSTSSPSGGCMICSAFVDAGLMHPQAVRRAVVYKLANLHRYGLSLRGYALYGPFLALLVMRFGTVRWALRKYARLVLYEEVRRSRPRRLKRLVLATAAHHLFHYGSLPWGMLSRLIKHDGGVHNKTVHDMLARNQLLFTYNLEDF